MQDFGRRLKWIRTSRTRRNIGVVEKPGLPRILALDNLRGLSAIYVVAFHTAFVPYPQLYVPPLLVNFVRFGSTGVYLFFIISGFSLSLTMPRHSASQSPSLSYTLSRFFRIAPLFYSLLILTLLRDWILFQAHHSVKEILGSVFFIFNFAPRHQEGIVSASWTIGVEMVYYCLFPIFYRFPLKAKLVLVASAAALHCSLIWIFGGSGILRLLFLGFIPIFIFGEMTFKLASACHDNIHARRRAPLVTMCGAGILLYCIMNPGRVEPFSSGVIPELFRIASGLGYSLVLFGLILRPVRIFENRIFGFYGKISYSLYLCHPTIVYLLSRPYRWVYKIVPGSLAYLVCVCLTMTIVTGIATITYRFIEKPSIRLGHNLLQFLIASRNTRKSALSAV